MASGPPVKSLRPADVHPADRQHAAPYSDEYYGEFGLEEDRIALWFYARMLRRLRPRGGRLLDFGCGTGHLLRRLGDPFEVYGYDASPHARARSPNHEARRRARRRVHPG